MAPVNGHLVERRDTLQAANTFFQLHRFSHRSRNTYVLSRSPPKRRRKEPRRSKVDLDGPEKSETSLRDSERVSSFSESGLTG